MFNTWIILVILVVVIFRNALMLYSSGLLNISTSSGSELYSAMTNIFALLISALLQNRRTIHRFKTSRRISFIPELFPSLMMSFARLYSLISKGSRFISSGDKT